MHPAYTQMKPATVALLILMNMMCTIAYFDYALGIKAEETTLVANSYGSNEERSLTKGLSNDLGRKLVEAIESHRPLPSIGVASHNEQRHLPTFVHGRIPGLRKGTNLGRTLAEAIGSHRDIPPIGVARHYEGKGTNVGRKLMDAGIDSSRGTESHRIPSINEVHLKMSQGTNRP